MKKNFKALNRALAMTAAICTLGVLGAPAASAAYYAEVMGSTDGPKRSCEWSKGSGDWYLHGMKYYDSNTRSWYVCNDGVWKSTTR